MTDTPKISDVTKIGGKINFTLYEPVYADPPGKSWGRHFTRVVKGYDDYCFYADMHIQVAVVQIANRPHLVHLDQITRIWKDGDTYSKYGPPRSRDERGRYVARLDGWLECIDFHPVTKELAQRRAKIAAARATARPYAQRLTAYYHRVAARCQKNPQTTWAIIVLILMALLLIGAST